MNTYTPTSINPHPHTKYRPSFNLEQIQHILSYMNDPSSPLDLQIRKVLIPLVSKIEIGAVNPAYKLSDIHTEKVLRKAETLRYENNLMSPEEEATYERDVLGFASPTSLTSHISEEK